MAGKWNPRFGEIRWRCNQGTSSMFLLSRVYRPETKESFQHGKFPSSGDRRSPSKPLLKWTHAFVYVRTCVCVCVCVCVCTCTEIARVPRCRFTRVLISPVNRNARPLRDYDRGVCFQNRSLFVILCKWSIRLASHRLLQLLPPMRKKTNTIWPFWLWFRSLSFFNFFLSNGCLDNEFQFSLWIYRSVWLVSDFGRDRSFWILFITLCKHSWSIGLC